MAEIKINIKNSTIKCPHCEFKNRNGTSFCARCGKKLSSSKKRSKRKLSKKLYKTSKAIFNSNSRNFRNKTINHVLDEVEDLKQRNFIKIDKTLRELNKNKNSKHGYLICDSCPVYYKLDGKINQDNKKTCACGGKLIFSNSPRYSD